MYESPIELIATEVSSQLDMEMGQMIYKAVQGVGVNVDKFELEKALRYDRHQYKKGYEDGVRDVIEKLKEKSTYHLYAYGMSYTDDFLDSIKKEMVGDTE